MLYEQFLITRLPRPAMLLLICFFGLPGLYSGLYAQQLRQAPQFDATISWVALPTAETKLLAQITTLQSQLAGDLPGSPAYIDRFRRIVYYKAVYRNLKQGQTIAQALEYAAVPAATLDGQQEASFTPKSVLLALHAEGMGLLTN